MEHTNNLVELAKELQRQKETKLDYIVNCDQIQTEWDIGTKQIRISIPENGDRKRFNFGITDYCHDQISEKTKIPRNFYRTLMAGHPELLTTNINELIRDRERRMIRTLDGNARALLSDRYRPIENYDVLFNSMEEFKRMNDQENAGIMIQRADLTDTHLYIKATSEKLVGRIISKMPANWDGFKTHDPHGDLMKRPEDRCMGGIIISNSEVGAGAYTVKPFMSILICNNGLIREKAFRRIHIGKRMDEGVIDWSQRTVEMEDGLLWSKLTDMITSTFNPEIFATWVDEIQKATEEIIEKPILAVNHIVKNYNEIPKDRTEDLLTEFANWGYTKWGLSQSITHMAQTCKNYNSQIEMEKLGDIILSIPVETLQKA